MAYSLALAPNELKIGRPVQAIPPWLEPPVVTTLSGEPYQRNPFEFSFGTFLQNPAQPSARP